MRSLTRAPTTQPASARAVRARDNQAVVVAQHQVASLTGEPGQLHRGFVARGALPPSIAESALVCPVAVLVTHCRCAGADAVAWIQFGHQWTAQEKVKGEEHTFPVCRWRHRGGRQVWKVRIDRYCVFVDDT